MFSRLAQIARFSKPTSARGYQFRRLSPVPGMRAIVKSLASHLPYREPAFYRRVGLVSKICGIGGTVVGLSSWAMGAWKGPDNSKDSLNVGWSKALAFPKSIFERLRLKGEEIHTQRKEQRESKTLSPSADSEAQDTTSNVSGSPNGPWYTQRQQHTVQAVPQEERKLEEDASQAEAAKSSGWRGGDRVVGLGETRGITSRRSSA